MFVSVFRFSHLKTAFFSVLVSSTVTICFSLVFGFRFLSIMMAVFLFCFLLLSGILGFFWFYRSVIPRDHLYNAFYPFF